MKKNFTVIVFFLTSYCFSQKTIIYVLDSIPTNDSNLNKTLDKYGIALKTGEPKDLIKNNYKTLDSIESVNKELFNKIDKDLKNSSLWQKIKQQNSTTRETNNEYYEYISFWDFGRIKKYKYRFIGTAGGRNELVQHETNYTREGKVKH